MMNVELTAPVEDR